MQSHFALTIIGEFLPNSNTYINMKHLYSFLLVSLICISADNLFAQKTLPVAAPSDARSAAYAFTNATIYTDYKTRTEKATLLIREGKVVACGTNVSIPAGTVVQDCNGKTIYPAFIDLYATGYGLPAPPTGGPGNPSGGGGSFGQRQAESSKKGAFAWNDIGSWAAVRDLAKPDANGDRSAA
jgi:hypothetical protein